MTERITAAQLRALTVTGKGRAKATSTEADLRALFLSRLALLWPEHPTLEEQYHYASPRKHRADFAHVPSRLLIELDGGVFTRGAHGSVSGILSDMERSRLASAHGWRVFRVGRKELTEKPAEVVEQLRQAIGWANENP